MRTSIKLAALGLAAAASFLLLGSAPAQAATPGGNNIAGLPVGQLSSGLPLGQLPIGKLPLLG